MSLSILSNGGQKMLEAAVDNSGISGLLDAVIGAEEVGTCKPSPRVYELAPARLKVSLAEVGFVSANSWDINGAASAGLTTFWIRRSTAEPPEELGFPAAHAVISLAELARMV
jgi:2-haloacid dehalogenase